MNVWSADRNERIRSLRMSGFYKPSEVLRLVFCLFHMAHFSESLNVDIMLIVLPYLFLFI